MPSMPTSLTGAAGEYYVAAELSRRGWLATVTIKNAPGTDVLAQELATGRTVAIQTKTSRGGKSFRLNAKDELTFPSDEGWVALVGLEAPTERPSFFIVPRSHLASMLYAVHRSWLETPGRGGRAHRDSSTRSIRRDSVVGYHDRWDLLAASASRAPYLGDPRLLELLRFDRLRPPHLPRALLRRVRGG